MIEGTYGRLEDPPRVLGHEGVGEIEALGDGTDGLGLEVGSRVIWVNLQCRGGGWRGVHMCLCVRGGCASEVLAS